MPNKKPGAIIVAGERWTPAVLQVVDRDDNGAPRTFRAMRHDESVHIEGGEAFFVVYASPAFHRLPQ